MKKAAISLYLNFRFIQLFLSQQEEEIQNHNTFFLISDPALLNEYTKKVWLSKEKIILDSIFAHR